MSTSDQTFVAGGFVAARFLMADHDVVVDPATERGVRVTSVATGVLDGCVIVDAVDDALAGALVTIIYPTTGEGSFAQLAGEYV